MGAATAVVRALLRRSHAAGSCSYERLAATAACRNGKLTARQVRNGAAVCNRGLCFQTSAWTSLGLEVAMLKKV